MRLNLELQHFEEAQVHFAQVIQEEAMVPAVGQVRVVIVGMRGCRQ